MEKKLKQKEHHEQCQVIAWARNTGDWRLKWLYAVPNGIRTSVGQASKLKREGLRKGIADLCLPIPNGRWHGLYLEMKTRVGRLSKDQEEFREYCDLVGYKHVIPKAAHEAIAELIEYVAQIKFVDISKYK